MADDDAVKERDARRKARDEKKTADLKAYGEQQAEQAKSNAEAMARHAEPPTPSQTEIDCAALGLPVTRDAAPAAAGGASYSTREARSTQATARS